MLESNQASHTYLLSQEFVCPRNRGWAEWKQAHAQAHVNSLFWLETALLSPSLAPSWLLSPCFLLFLSLGMVLGLESIAAAGQRNTLMYKVHPKLFIISFILNFRQIFLSYKTISNISQHVFGLFCKVWSLSLPGCWSYTNFCSAQVGYIQCTPMIWFSTPQGS